MATTNLSKSILIYPSQSEVNDESIAVTVKSLAKFSETVQVQASQSIQELHQNRLKQLRKELDFIKDTDWKYESIDKYLGQANN